MHPVRYSSMEKAPASGKKWILWIALIIAAAVFITVALLVLAGGKGLSARFDDPGQILSAYDPETFPALTLEPDGVASVRMARDDLYYFARKAGILDALEDTLAQQGCTGMGLRLADGGAVVYARCRTLGFLPLTYKAKVAVDWQDGVLTVTPEKVWLGNAISLSPRRWPDVFGSPLRIDPGAVSDSVLSVSLKGEALEVRLTGLGEPLTGQLLADRDMLRAAGIYGVSVSDDETAAALLSSAPEGVISMDAADGLLRSAADAPEALTALLAGCTSESVQSLWPELETNYRRALLSRVAQAAEERHAAVDGALALEQARYEKLLTAVRESYKSGSLAIGETGFFSAASGEAVTAGGLTTLSATDTDSRIVFLYTLSDSRDVCLEDMPAVSTVPRADRKVDESRLSSAEVYDLGVVLTSEGNVPLLLHRDRDGAFLLRVLSDTDYVSALVERSIPVLCADDFPEPACVVTRDSGEGWNGAQILLLK